MTQCRRSQTPEAPLKTFSYNARHLVTGVTYAAPSPIPTPSPISYGYDAAGNRTSMSDGLGSKSYSYDQLSQLTAETRTFNDVGSFALSYDYNLAGDFKKVTDPTNMTISYAYDWSRRLTSVTGSDNLFMGITNYASNFQYRAWGALKAMTNGANRTSSLLYNSRLQPSHFEVNGLVSQNYDYYNDGRLRFVDNLMDANFDRSYSYDRLARLMLATTGGLARGDSGETPYHETFGYDAFSNLTSRYTLSWSQDEMWDSPAYANNRRSGWGYDADGRNTTIGTRTYTFDAAGRTTLMTGQRWVVNHYINTSQSVGYDGDGQRIKEVVNGVTTYYLTSTVFRGSIVAELNSSGQKTAGYVYAPGGVLLARQVLAGANSYIAWKHGTPAGTGQHDFNVGGAFGNGGAQRVELDPLGASVPLEYVPPPETQSEGDVGVGQSGGVLDARYANFFDVSGGCMMDYMAASCGMAMGAVNSEAGVLTDPYESPEFWWNQKLADAGVGGWMKFHAYADGYAEYIPVNGVYRGNGLWEIKRNSDEEDSKQVSPSDVDLSPDQRKIVEDINNTIKELLKNQACRELIQGGPDDDFRIEHAAPRLEWLEKNRGITYFHGIEFNAGSGPAIAAVRGTYTGFGRSSPRIVLGYYYFQDSVGPAGKGLKEYWNISTNEARVLALIHELKHDLTHVSHRGREGSPESNDGWNQKILEICMGIKRSIPEH